MATGAAARSSDADQALQQLSEQVAGKTPPATLGWQKQLNFTSNAHAHLS